MAAACRSTRSSRALRNSLRSASSNPSFRLTFASSRRSPGVCFFTFIKRLFSLLQLCFVGLPFVGELRPEYFTCIDELRQHLLPLLDEAALGVDLTLADVGLPNQERLFPIGGFAIPLVQGGTFFRKLALARVEFLAASVDRLLPLIKFRGSGIQLLVAALIFLLCRPEQVASSPNRLPQRLDIGTFGFRIRSNRWQVESFLLRNGQRLFVFGLDQLFPVAGSPAWPEADSVHACAGAPRTGCPLPSGPCPYPSFSPSRNISLMGRTGRFSSSPTILQHLLNGGVHGTGIELPASPGVGRFAPKLHQSVDPAKEVRRLPCCGTQGMVGFGSRSQKGRRDEGPQPPVVAVVADRANMTVFHMAQRIGQDGQSDLVRSVLQHRLVHLPLVATELIGRAGEWPLPANIDEQLFECTPAGLQHVTAMPPGRPCPRGRAVPATLRSVSANASATAS